MLLELLQMPACFVDDKANIVALNAAWRDLGLEGGKNEVSAPWANSFFPEERYTALSYFRSAISTGNRTELECRLQGNGGGPRWHLIDLQPVSDQAVQENCWLCIATDIERLKVREKNLERRASTRTDMLDVSVDCIKLIALDGTIVHMNKAGCQALGISEDTGFGMPWLELLPEDVRAAGNQALVTARAGEFVRFPGKSVLPGRNPQYWDNMLTPVVDPGGAATAILCVSREVTAEREALDALRQSRDRLEIAVRVGGLGIWDYDIEQDRLQCDEAWYRIMGRDPDTPLRSIDEFRPLVHPDDRERATEVIQASAELIATGRDYAIMFRIIRPDGDIRFVRSAACLVQGISGNPRRAVGFVVDITDAWSGEMALRDANRALEEEKTSLARQSLEDPLTGIANRRHLDSELTRLCILAGQASEPMSIGMIDVDRFKAYNDRYGHLAGDTVLRQIATAFQSVARQSDFVARYGGEEFVFILRGVTDPAPFLERYASTIANLGITHADSPTGYVTVSCGCAVFDTCFNLSPSRLLEVSDAILYEAKIAGRNRYIIRVASA